MPEGGRETGPSVPLDAKVAALAASQDAVVALGQLTALGLSDSGVRKRAAAGRLHRLHRGVYSLVPPQLLSVRGTLRAAVLACGPGCAVSHRAAAFLHGLIAAVPRSVDVVAPTHRVAPGIRVHRSLTLTPADITTVRGIPCTTIARTMLDLGDDLNQAEHEQVLNQADVMGRLSLPALDDQLARNPTRAAAAGLRAALIVYRPRQAPAESRLELDFLTLIRAHGLPEPERQIVLELQDGGPPIRPDFMWRAAKVVVELDGRPYHVARRAFESDRRRDQRLVRAGWRCVRITWRQLHDEPETVLALLLDLLATPPPPPPPPSPGQR